MSDVFRTATVSVQENGTKRATEEPVYFDQTFALGMQPDRTQDARLVPQWSLPDHTARDTAEASLARYQQALQGGGSLMDAGHITVRRTTHATLVDGELFLRTPHANLAAFFPSRVEKEDFFSFLPREEIGYTMRQLGEHLAETLLHMILQRDSLCTLVVCFARESLPGSGNGPRQQQAEQFTGLPVLEPHRCATCPVSSRVCGARHTTAWWP